MIPELLLTIMALSQLSATKHRCLVGSPRHCELGRAVVQRLLVDKNRDPALVYCGLMFEKDGQEADAALQKIIYDLWDADPESPPKRREREDLPDPHLEVLAWSNGVYRFPESLFNKFTPGTKSYVELTELKEEVLKVCPEAAQAETGPSGVSTAPRAGGKPDFTIEGGKEPLDVTRDVDLPIISAADFNFSRPGLSSWMFGYGCGVRVAVYMFV